MPELPEVETVRQDLFSLCGQSFANVRAPDAIARGELRRGLNQRINSIERRGKYLMFVFHDRRLVVHLGMSGRLFLADEKMEHPHLRWSLRVSNGAHLLFVDRRRFGRFRVVSHGECAFPGMEALGPEPLDHAFGPIRLRQAANNSTRSIKTVLLDQRVVAGLGNIYVDEALHAARIHPARVGLDDRASRVLSTAIKRIVRSAIQQGGTSFSLHRDGLVAPGSFARKLRVFGRAGQHCDCGETILKITHRGRGTHLCPRCQPLEPNRRRRATRSG